MTEKSSDDTQRIYRRVRGELLDDFDEEIEMEMDDERMDRLVEDIDAKQPFTTGLDRSIYFRELFRLQGELVKLQDWIVHKKLKVVVLFEGRDAAGKGGIIRITQRLNPRVCRVSALPAPSPREQTQWYFQRYVGHPPAASDGPRPQLGTTARASSASWGSHRGRAEDFFRSSPSSRRCSSARASSSSPAPPSATSRTCASRCACTIRSQWKLSPIDLESRRCGRRTHGPRRR